MSIRRQALEDLVEDAWIDHLDTLSRECAGGGVLVSATARANGALPDAWAAFRPLRAIRYDRRRRELEVVVGGDSSGPLLRCFIADPHQLLPVDSSVGHALVVLDRTGTRTLIEIRSNGAQPADPGRRA